MPARDRFLEASGSIDTDVLIVGAGIAGCATAYFAAREGLEVVVIDRGDINAEGSGTNAGSLHAQIISRFFKTTNPLWVRGRSQLIPFALQGLRVWRRLADELDADIELRLQGGLMVAETEDQLEILKRKVDLERAQGLDADILTGDALRTAAPYLAETVVGAEHCRDEGEVNPLIATVAMARGAEAAGARIMGRTALKALEAGREGMVAATDRGSIRCRRLVNAAGPWAGDVGRLVGVTVPVEGLPRHMNVTEPVAPLIAHLVQHADKRLSLKQAENGTIIIGGGWPTKVDPRTGQVAVLRETVESNLDVALRLAPRLAGIHLVRTWGGILGLTPDGLAILGPVESVPGYVNGVVPNAGYTAGPLCGLLLAEYLRGKTPSLDLAPYAVERFESIGAGPDLAAL